MLIESLLGKRLADEPKDAQTPGHRLLLRGGYIRQVGQGIYSLLPLAYKICQKVEQIVREEMNAIEGQEVLMPVVSPAELWMESGRYQAISGELLRFVDRTDHPCVLNMTHEEVVVDLARSNVESYRQFPFMVYQFQTKFRDEARSRGGLIRVREFTMKDAYSFHRTWDDLRAYYDRCHAAYARIFERCGSRNVIDIESDTGMMGGKVAHEFMLISDVGEDTLVICRESGYRANREVAKAAWVFEGDATLEPLVQVPTPGQKSIQDVAAFLNRPVTKTCKCVAFMADEKPVLAFVRGDFEVNQAKLKRALGGVGVLRMMEEAEFRAIGSVPGYAGPVGIDQSKVRLIVDESVLKTNNLIIGANAFDLHSTGFNASRDLVNFGAFAQDTDIKDVREGDPCPLSGNPLTLTRGIEVGNIFQLGTKYTESMNFQYDEEDGKRTFPIMGCYGIGIGRTMASVLEECRDENGPLWPITIAPFQVEICCLQGKVDEIRQKAEELYKTVQQAGVDVLLDKRAVSAGFMFADADLIGAPIRLIVSKRNLEQNQVEVKYRIKYAVEGLPNVLSLDSLVTDLQSLIQRLIKEVEG